jgi:hypothetical protein
LRRFRITKAMIRVILRDDAMAFLAALPALAPRATLPDREAS